MRARLPGHGRSSAAAARLVARAARPAVRAYDELSRFQAVELDSETVATSAGPRSTPSVAPPVSEESVREPVADDPRREGVAGPAVAVPAVPVSSLRVEPEREAQRETVSPPPRVGRDVAQSQPLEPSEVPREEPVSGVAPMWTLVEDPVPEVHARRAAEPSVPQDAPGWQSLARPQASDERLATRAEPQGALAAAARGRAPTPASSSDAAAPPLQLPAAPPPVVSAGSHGPAPAVPSASPPAPPAPPAHPQVLIDRIEVITPPARPPAPDPFLSLAGRRVGASRHGVRS